MANIATFPSTISATGSLSRAPPPSYFDSLRRTITPQPLRRKLPPYKPKVYVDPIWGRQAGLRNNPARDAIWGGQAHGGGSNRRRTNQVGPRDLHARDVLGKIRNVIGHKGRDGSEASKAKVVGKRESKWWGFISRKV